jgi:hypothetical protein
MSHLAIIMSSSHDSQSVLIHELVEFTMQNGARIARAVEFPLWDLRN